MINDVYSNIERLQIAISPVLKCDEISNVKVAEVERNECDLIIGIKRINERLMYLLSRVDIN